MDATQVVGVVLVVSLLVAAVVGTSWVMADQLGTWLAPVLIWGGSFAFTGLIVGGLMLAVGELP